jgi:MraZ protein
MATFIGDFVCKADAKGRIVLPSLFKKVMNAIEENCFVIRKDLFEDCLILSPYSDWEVEMEDIRSRVNLYNRAENKFYRQYYRGAAEVSYDANGRMLLPKRLMEKIGLPKEMVLVGVDKKIELWSKTAYESEELSEGELALMAENILGGVDNREKEAEK